MSEEIRPALTAEEWAGQYHAPNESQRVYLHSLGVQVVNGTLAVEVPAASMRSLAALALQHAGPDGGPLFTWEMVERLRDADNKSPFDLRGIAARIALLLPPREP